jgi:hypothetical protein
MIRPVRPLHCQDDMGRDRRALSYSARPAAAQSPDPASLDAALDCVAAVLIGLLLFACSGGYRAIEERGKDRAAAAMGRKGGAARANSMTAERRAEIAREAAKGRWSKSS